MNIADIQPLIGALGFPIVVAGFLLIRGTKVITDLTKAIDSNTAMIARLMDRGEKS